MNATPRPTPDVTYRGELLNDAAWQAHLEILQGYLDGKPLPLRDGLDFHQASVAIHAAGLVYDAANASSAVAFTWCKYKLTPYGELYARQRLKLTK